MELSLEPCWEINPTLWRLFCQLTRRDVTYTSPNWTELDVFNYIENHNKALKEARPGARRLCPL